MCAQTFLHTLKQKLKALPKQDLAQQLACYSKIIADGVEEGLSEEEAVARLGSVDSIAEQIAMEYATTPTVNLTSRTSILLLILGFPSWFPLLIAVFAVLLSLFVSLWTVVISLWAIFGALIGSTFGGAVACAIFAIGGAPYTALVMLAASLVCAGVAILLFFGCTTVTKGTARLTKASVLALLKRRKKHV